MHRKLALLFGAVIALMMPMMPANAITNGTPDGNGHPFVGQILFFDPSYQDPRFKDPGGWFNCSGTLLDATHVVTAGHCTYGTGTEGQTTEGGSGGTDTWVSFLPTSDYSMLPPSRCFADASGYTPDTSGCDAWVTETGQGNYARYLAWEAALDGSSDWTRGTSYPHPDFDPNAFFLHDAGVIVLDQGVSMSTYGQLPTQGLIDQLYEANHQATYTPVGYGLTFSMPWGSLGDDSRNVATVKINDLNGVYGVGKGTAVGYSSNKGKPHTGGTCFGDSGGPTFPNNPEYDTTVITVTSFGIDGNCRAGGGGYRLDQPDDLSWLKAEFGLEPPPAS